MGTVGDDRSSEKSLIELDGMPQSNETVWFSQILFSDDLGLGFL